MSNQGRLSIIYTAARNKLKKTVHIRNNPPFFSSPYWLYRMNNRYEGYVDFVVAGNPDAAVEFKITTLPDWAQGDQYGDGGPGRLKLDGENISYTPQGYYLMQVDLDKLTYKLTPSEPVP